MFKVVDCVEVNLLHPHRKWVVWLVWWNVIVYLLVLSRLCCTSGIVCGLLVGFCQNFLDVLEQDGEVVVVFWPIFRSIEYINAHFLL